MMLRGGRELSRVVWTFALAIGLGAALPDQASAAGPAKPGAEAAGGAAKTAETKVAETKAAVKVPDLNGYWSSEGGGVVKFEQTKTNVNGRLARLSETGKKRGFSMGEETVHAVLNGPVVSGAILLKYAEKYKTSCPERWSHWNQLQLKLNAKGDVLVGRFSNTQITADCKEVDKGWIPYKLTRIAKPSDAGI